MPYNYLFEEHGSTIEDIAALAKDSIIIFDEAHNIPAICEQAKEHSISVSTLARALHQLSELR